MNIAVNLQPKQDSSNSYPPDVLFTYHEDTHTVTIRMDLPDRTIEVSADEFLKFADTISYTRSRK